MSDGRGSVRAVGQYVEALGRFKAFAVGKFGGPAATPDIRAAEAAAVLRYLKGVEEKIPTPGAPSWGPVGGRIAKVAITSLLPEAVRDELWTYAAAICGRADADGVPFLTAHPDPAADYAVLRKTLGMTGPAPTAPTTPAEADELEAEAKKPVKGPTPGDKFNTGLLMVAIIVIAALGHRAR